jgi:S-DNA-T family DNA segregation ATPase FtsK/SpoIIIE
MAKRKKQASRSSNGTVAKEIKILLGALVYVFLFVAIFSDNGLLIESVHSFLRSIFGVLTPLLAVVMLWYAAHKLMPQKVGARFNAVAGSVLVTISLAGLIHSFMGEDGAAVAAAGMGGGWIGNFLFNGLNTIVGGIVSRLILIILVLVSFMLIFDRAFIASFIQAKPEDEEEEDDAYGSTTESKVKVMGEIQAGPGESSPLKKFRFGKAAPVAAEVAPKAAVRAPAPRRSDWNYPPITLLRAMDEKPQAGNIKSRMELIQKTLKDFNIDVTMTDVRIGPTVSQYTLKPAEGVKLTQITARQDDLALALAAESLRVEAPIPGKSLVGVEIPNDKKAIVGLRDILKHASFANHSSKLAIALGRDAAGDPSVVDLARMPHVLIAGATGSGKSVCINTLILSLLMNNSPDELRMILVDPKRVELTLYNGIPHLLTPVITEPKDTVKALNWCVREMERRYKLLSGTGKRNIEQYNQSPDLGEGRLPFIVVIIDELADLMMASAREVESKIVRLAQMARAVGIHLVVATQRPSVDVITGLIKANIPTRIAFAVTSQIDSRTIIDSTGAEKLLGYGDMLYMSTDLGKPRRVQGVYCSEEEISSVIAHIRQQETADRYDPTILEDQVESRFVSAGGLDDEEEALLREAYDLVRKHNRASTSMLQTYMKLGYNKAKRIITAMEERGMIGPERGGKQREVYNIDVNGAGAEEDVTEGGGIMPYPEQD